MKIGGMAKGIYLMNDKSSESKFIFYGCWILTIILSAFFQLSDANFQNGPSPDFRAHTLIKPKVLHGRHRREIVHTKEDGNKHVELVIINFEMDGAQVILDMKLNRDFIPIDFKHRIQHKDGFTVETPENNEICHYQGSIRGINNSWVAVSTCAGLKGVIYNGVGMHYIMPANETLDGVHYIFKHSDLITNNNKKCGYKGAHEDIYSQPPHLHTNKLSRKKRSNEIIRGPYNANRQSRYVELVLVIDKKEYVELGENLDKVHYHCKDIANIINALYTPLNIFVALVGVEVWTDTDQIRLVTQGDTTLSNFLRYRREILVKEIPNDNAQLLTRVNFADGVVGKALKGPICTYEFSGGVSMDHSNVIGLVAATVAHEMGHNFGMEHDSDDCDCPDDRCIMAPSSSSTGPIHWSNCSLEYLALAFEHGMDYCLRNKPKKLFDSPMCGNGFVEPGEQCDCGLKDNCNNPCCNATTCMLHANASCATGECCDLTICRPKNAGFQCRSAEHECDLPEYCTGQSEYCPKDVFKIDGESCNMGKAFCYQGCCRTHNDQCELLWGPSGSSSDSKCYEMNNKGTKNGNCGYNRMDSSYVKCTDENNLCGMLHCKHLNERLEFGMESVAILSHAFINNGREIIACRSVLVDLGLNQVDPGLAPDGAKCAPGKMCVNQKCMPISDLRLLTIGKNACPNNCGGNGICNSLGHCHCNRGFRPPDCVQPGFGGSDDSGPIEDPNARSDFTTALYIIFFGIIPIIMMISVIWYRRHSSNRLSWKKDIIPKYVFHLDCLNFKNSRLNIRKKKLNNGKSRFKNFKNFFTMSSNLNGLNSTTVDSNNIKINNNGSDNNDVNNTKIFTISSSLPKKKIEITKKHLISTTNPQIINYSNNINNKNSFLPVESQLKIDISPSDSSLVSERIGNFEKTLHDNRSHSKLFNEKPGCSSSSSAFIQSESSPIYSNLSNFIPKVFEEAQICNKNINIKNNEELNDCKTQKSLSFYNKKAPVPPNLSKISNNI